MKWYNCVMANIQLRVIENSDDGVPCALPGCTEIVHQPPGGGPRRRYCSDAHRSAAARLRKSGQMVGEESAGTPPLSIATGSASELGSQLSAVVAQLGQISRALVDRLAVLEPETVEARILRVEASASERITAAEARVAEQLEA